MNTYKADKGAVNQPSLDKGAVQPTAVTVIIPGLSLSGSAGNAVVKQIGGQKYPFRTN